MLNIPHINCSNYMFPKLENCHTTISIDNHQTIIATELTEHDIISHIKVLLDNDFKQARNLARNITKYIIFYRSTMSRIPFDSKIEDFLFKWKNTDARQIVIPFKYESLYV